jgi:DNA-binding SARP family transcriptional activator/tetratricopeptide (TPR) repeat protein
VSGGGLQFRVLGPFEVLDKGQPTGPAGAKRRGLLAVLALQANRQVMVADLIDGLWADRPPPSAANLVQTYVSAWRKVLEPAATTRDGTARLVTVGHAYRLRVEPGELDLDQFAQVMAGGRSASAAGDQQEAARHFAQAVGLWRGPPLADLAELPFHRAAANGLAELHLQALEAWADAALRTGHGQQVLAALQDARAREPLRERLSELTMWALFQDGRQAGALSVYEQTRRLLADELGADPGAGLRAMHAQVLRHDPALRPAATAPGRVTASGAVPGPVPRQLPTALRHFAGRAAELKVLDGLIAQAGGPGGTVVISAIGGTGGMGKTALAVHWAHQVAERFPDGQLYVNLRGFEPAGEPVSPAEAIRGFLEALGVPADQVPVSLQAQAGLYRSLVAGKRLMILLDNAADAGQVRALLPGSAECLVLVTSRARMAGLAAAEGARPIWLDTLSDEEAAQLLTARIGPERLAADPPTVAELTQLCAGLPLALAIVAGRAAAHPDIRLAALAADLTGEPERLDAFDTGEDATSVRAVFSWSYRQLSIEAARMFRLLALHPGPDISAAAAASLAGVPPRAARKMLTALAAGSLVSEQLPGRYVLHDLLRSYAGEQASQLDSATDRRAAVHRLLDHYLHTAYQAALLCDRKPSPLDQAPQDHVTPESAGSRGEAMAWFQAERPALVAVAALAAEFGFDSYQWQIPDVVRDYLYRSGHWRDWAAMNQLALDAAERLGDHAQLGWAHANIGMTHYRSGDNQATITHATEALAQFRLAGHPAGQARAHRALALALSQTGDETAALGHARQALELYRTAGDQVEQARTLEVIGLRYVKLGELQRGIGYCEQAVALYREIGGGLIDIGGALDDLGHAQQLAGDYARAIASYQESISLTTQADHRYGQALTLFALGDTYDATGDDANARATWQRALDALGDMTHPDADRVRARLRQPGGS